MEPRSFKRGNRRLGLSRLPVRHKLQWSHVLSNVETCDKRLRAAQETSASMEPRSFKRGNKGKKATASELIGASMEPRSFKRGN